MILLAREVLDGRPDQQQLGGLDVVVRRNAFGRQVDSFETDLRVDGLAAGRCGRCSSARRGSRRSARACRCSPRCPGSRWRLRHGPAAGRAVAVRQRAVLATAFHPELTGDLRVHALFCDW